MWRGRESNYGRVRAKATTVQLRLCHESRAAPCLYKQVQSRLSAVARVDPVRASVPNETELHASPLSRLVLDITCGRSYPAIVYPL